MRALPEGAVLFTFVEAPTFHVGLRVSGLKERLEASRREQIPVRFEIQCKNRHFALIRVSSVDGVPVKSDEKNMWLESASLTPGGAGPFPGACSY